MFTHQAAVKSVNKKFSELGEYRFKQYCDVLFARLVANQYESDERKYWINFVAFENMEKIERDDMSVIEAVDMAMDTYYKTK